MKVILLEKVPKLGALGEKVKVKPGFARNFLIPQGKALPDNAMNNAYFEAKRAELEKISKEKLNDAEKRAKALEGTRVTIAVQAGEEGRLFGSVTAHDIVRALKEEGHTVAKNEIWMTGGPIRQVGEYEIELYLHGNEVVSKITVVVVAS